MLARLLVLASMLLVSRQEPDTARAAWEAANSLGLAHVAAARSVSGTELSDGDLERAVARAERRKQRILAEVRTPGLPEWAGLHSTEGLGVTRLWAAPGAGFVYEANSCLGPWDANEGEIVRWDASGFVVRFSVDPGRSLPGISAGRARPWVDEAWHVVRWGEERLLLPAAGLIPFCNEVNAGFGWSLSFPRRHTIPPALESSMPDVSALGAPELPSRYRPFLLERPLEGRLVQVADPAPAERPFGEPMRLQARAVVDLGAQHGLLPGMVLHCVDAGSDGEGEIVEVGETTSAVEFCFVLQEPLVGMPEVGWRVSTRAPRR